MLRTGDQYLTNLRQRGGEIYIGGERIEDVSTHPAFHNAARTVAKMYDTTSDPANRDSLSYLDPETNTRCNSIFLKPRTKQDLEARNRVHEAWAKCSWGLFGRSPDHVAGWITGMACLPEIFDLHQQGFSKNILKYYRYIRDNDLFVAYAIVPPAGAKSASSVSNLAQTAAPDSKWAASAGLQVVKEDDWGLTINGFKILATAAILADEVLIGNYQPLAKGQEAFAVTCALPINSPGLKLLSRRSFEQGANRFDNPFAFQYDETDTVVFCDHVRVPWERVFAHGHTDSARAIFNDTPAHVLGNAQAHIRHLAKLRLILGIMAKVLEANDIANLPPVRDTMGMLATRVAMVESLVIAETAVPEPWANGYIAQDRQSMYSTMAYTMEYYPQFIQTMRELLGSHPFQQPADVHVFDNPVTAEIYSKFTLAEPRDSFERYKLMRMAWDLVGSEFASRHTQYEMFYNGAKHVARGRAHHHFRWDVVNAEADRALASVGGYDDRAG